MNKSREYITAQVAVSVADVIDNLDFDEQERWGKLSVEEQEEILEHIEFRLEEELDGVNGGPHEIVHDHLYGAIADLVTADKKAVDAIALMMA